MGLLRTWATPLTAGAFLLLAVTGVLMFFHLDTGLNKAAHEWLSWAMLAGVAMHVVVNWRPFANYLKKPKALAVMGLFAIVLAASFFAPGGVKVPWREVGDHVATAPLTTVAQLLGETPEAIATKLAAEGLTISNASTDTLRTLANGDRGTEMRAIAKLFGKE